MSTQVTSDDLASGVTHAGYGAMAGVILGLILGILDQLNTTAAAAPFISPLVVFLLTVLAAALIGFGYGVRLSNNSAPEKPVA